jgi:hypothetical protein
VELRNSCQHPASRICRVSSAGATAAPPELGGFPRDKDGRRDDPAGVSHSSYAPGHLLSGGRGRPAVTALPAAGERYDSFSAELPGGRVGMDNDHA